MCVWGGGGLSEEHNSSCMFSSLLPRNIYHRNACRARAGEQGGLRLKNDFEPGCLLHILSASWGFVTDTVSPRQLGLNDRPHLCRSLVLRADCIYLSPDPLCVQIWCYSFLLTEYTNVAKEGQKRNGGGGL